MKKTFTIGTDTTTIKTKCANVESAKKRAMFEFGENTSISIYRCDSHGVCIDALEKTPGSRWVWTLKNYRVCK